MGSRKGGQMARGKGTGRGEEEEKRGGGDWDEGVRVGIGGRDPGDRE